MSGSNRCFWICIQVFQESGKVVWYSLLFNMETYITMYKIDSQWAFAVCLRELKQGLCINLEGWGGEGDGMGGTYVHLWLIHVDV